MFAIKRQVKQLGFTLIELMVVIAIIGLLMAAGLVSFTNAQKTARDAKALADIDAVAQAQEQFASNNSGSYAVGANFGAMGTALGTSYFPQGTPTDSKNTGVYIYTGVSTATGYCVCAGLEQLGKGNATAAGTAQTCTYGTVGAAVQGYYCRQNQQ